MIVVDSSAVVAILFDEAEAEEYLRIIARATGRLLSAVGLLETSMVVAGRSSRPSPWAKLDVFLSSAKLDIVAHDRDLALLARDAFLRYGKGRHQARLNMGDCASYALAKSRDLPLLFKGDDFTRTDIARAS